MTWLQQVRILLTIPCPRIDTSVSCLIVPASTLLTPLMWYPEESSVEGMLGSHCSSDLWRKTAKTVIRSFSLFLCLLCLHSSCPFPLVLWEPKMWSGSHSICADLTLLNWLTFFIYFLNYIIICCYVQCICVSVVGQLENLGNWFWGIISGFVALMADKVSHLVGSFCVSLWSPNSKLTCQLFFKRFLLNCVCACECSACGD